MTEVATRMAEKPTQPEELTVPQSDKGQTISAGDVVIFDGVLYIVTLPPAGYGADVCCLRPLKEANDFQVAPDDAYVGVMVKLNGKKRFIGPFADSIFVRDGGADRERNVANLREIVRGDDVKGTMFEDEE